MEHIAILILAAGASSRMRGPDKLLEKIDGEALLLRVIGRAVTMGAPVLVSVSDSAEKRHALIKQTSAEILSVPDATTGMAASFRAFSRAPTHDLAGVVVMLADMPDVTTDDLNVLVSEFRNLNCEKIVRACGPDKTPGHPVIFPRRLFGGFGRLVGDQGARDILRHEDVVLVPIADNHALIDLDTPEDWQNWRATQPD